MEKERRCTSPDGTEVEERAEGRKVIRGYAAVFGAVADLGTFTESIEPGAFADAIQSSDVRALFNHEPDHILGRTKSGTLRLKEDEKGLHYEADAPNTTLGRDITESIKRGDISGNSFSFTIREDRWEPVEPPEEAEGPPKMHRTIVAVDRLFDVGPVTYPAYEQTVVSARSEERARAEAKNVALDRLKGIHAGRVRDGDIRLLL